MTARRPAFTLGDRLRKARSCAGLDQRQLAERVGVNRNTLALWELDRHRPSTAAIALVAAVTDTDAEWLEGKAAGDA